MANSPNLSDPNHQFDKTKQYNKVVFQQGKPILDVDLNDMSSALQAQATSALIEKMGYSPSQLDYREWAMTAVDAINPLSDRNRDNFALSLGRLDTHKGIIDTASYRSSDSLSPSIIFDYGKITSLNATAVGDRPFANYLFKGVITNSSFNSITDSEKSFGSNASDNARLDAYDHYEVVSSAYDNVALSSNTDTVTPILDHVVRIKEGACRVHFVATGEEREISLFNNDTVSWATALDNVPAVGTEYYILPPNTLTDYRALYDAVVDQDRSVSEGLTNLPKLLTYVQAFEEDVSSTEDSEIESTALGYETTHRTQLRWCVRVALMYTSVEGDTYNNEAVGSLKPSHVFNLLSDNKFVDYQAILDSTDEDASQHNGYGQSYFWKQTDSAGNLVNPYIQTQESPFKELGLTPAHFLSAEENNLDRIYWAFLKGLFLKVSGSTFNDFVMLNVFNSETKSNSVSLAFETLSEYFVPGAQTDTTQTPMVHAWLSTGSAYQRLQGDNNGVGAFFKAPPRVFHTQADLSADNLKSRTLHGISGLGSAQGQTREGAILGSSVDYTLPNTDVSLGQSGYGVGAIKPLDLLAQSGENEGFLTGSSSYLLREKGDRSSHTVNFNDEDMGWSLYKHDSSELANNNQTDFTIRAWNEGMAQAVAFSNGINFRKLAIKTTAHKSMDLFTISETPIATNLEPQLALKAMTASSTAFQIPTGQSQEKNGNLFIDSYSGAINSPLDFDSVDFNSSSFIPANRSEFDPKSLLAQYQAPNGGIVAFNQSQTAGRDIGLTYGPWNRFRGNHSHSSELFEGGELLDNNDTPLYSNDLMSNRCTAMRLRYHIGDFYPGELDSNGVPRNLLVDSLNLFMKVEPLSLAHWMTMPKHQHSILEGSFTFAEGIEALLKVAHGLGDTQKLVNSFGQSLVQANSPALTEGGDYQSRSVGDIDPLNLPFEHHRQPFVHWYHPAMHKIKAPHPDDSSRYYVNSQNQTFDLTVYPKFGRRSLIVPALVPFKFGEAEVDHPTNTSISYTVPYIKSEQDNSPNPPTTETSPEILGSFSQSTVEGGFTVDISDDDNGTTATNVATGVLPYFHHSSKPTGTGTTTYPTDSGSLNVRNNQIAFPAIGTGGDEITPTPVFIPASRVYAKNFSTSSTEPHVGFNMIMRSDSSSSWDDITAYEDTVFPYDEKVMYYQLEAGGANELPNNFNQDYEAWSTPVLRASVNTQTVAGIVDLVRTSFDTGLDDAVLSDDYDFTMPTNLGVNYDADTVGSPFFDMSQAPAIGPDHTTDTLFVGDLGTALGGFTDRAGFISPLNLGVPMRMKSGVMANGMDDGGITFRDSFERAEAVLDNESSLLTQSFTAINRMGLQQKLMWNSSFRVLHTRPGGIDQASTAPKSLTEVIIAHDRTDGDMTAQPFLPVNHAKRKPFIHLMSAHPNANQSWDNTRYLGHLYPMISDSTGGSHDATLDNQSHYDYTDPKVLTSSMGDTFAVDPFDSMVNTAVFGNNNPLRETENQNVNSGIEIDLLSELNTIHATPNVYNLDTIGQINGQDMSLLSTMPTANELTLPGDHEVVFVLYTGHYGANMYSPNDQIDVSTVPPVAGCHLTATIEVNRPSERVSSTPTEERHYGVTSGGSTIKTYAIPSTK